MTSCNGKPIAKNDTQHSGMKNELRKRKQNIQMHENRKNVMI